MSRNLLFKLLKSCAAALILMGGLLCSNVSQAAQDENLRIAKFYFPQNVYKIFVLREIVDAVKEMPQDYRADYERTFMERVNFNVMLEKSSSALEQGLTPAEKQEISRIISSPLGAEYSRVLASVVSLENATEWRGFANAHKAESISTLGVKTRKLIMSSPAGADYITKTVMCALLQKYRPATLEVERSKGRCS